jgi:hypothetical protein
VTQTKTRKGGQNTNINTPFIFSTTCFALANGANNVVINAYNAHLLLYFIVQCLRTETWQKQHHSTSSFGGTDKAEPTWSHLTSDCDPYTPQTMAIIDINSNWTSASVRRNFCNMGLWFSIGLPGPTRIQAQGVLSCSFTS